MNRPYSFYSPFDKPRTTAIQRYIRLVSEGMDADPIWNDLKAQTFLDDDAIVAAHASGGYSYRQLAAYFGVHFTTVGRIARSKKSGRMLLR